jgi:dihydroneopterin aldolase
MEQNSMTSVFVENMSVYALKGLYPEESLVQNQFLVSIKASYFPEDLNPNEYLDYRFLAETIHQSFNSDIQLLEKLATHIQNQILKEWAIVRKIEIKIKKCNPSFTDFQMDGVGVEIVWNKLK